MVVAERGPVGTSRMKGYPMYRLSSPQVVCPKPSSATTWMKALWPGVDGATTVALSPSEVTVQPAGADQLKVSGSPSGSVALACTVSVPPSWTVPGVAETEETSENAVAFRAGSESLVTAVDEALATLAEDGTLAEISERYFGEDVSQP